MPTIHGKKFQRISWELESRAVSSFPRPQCTMQTMLRLAQYVMRMNPDCAIARNKQECLPSIIDGIHDTWHQ